LLSDFPRAALCTGSYTSETSLHSRDRFVNFSFEHRYLFLHPNRVPRTDRHGPVRVPISEIGDWQRIEILQIRTSPNKIDRTATAFR